LSKNFFTDSLFQGKKQKLKSTLKSDKSKKKKLKKHRILKQNFKLFKIDPEIIFNFYYWCVKLN